MRMRMRVGRKGRRGSGRAKTVVGVDAEGQAEEAVLAGRWRWTEGRSGSAQPETQEGDRGDQGGQGGRAEAEGDDHGNTRS